MSPRNIHTRARGFGTCRSPLRQEGYFTVRTVGRGEKEVDGKNPTVAAQAVA